VTSPAQLHLFVAADRWVERHIVLSTTDDGVSYTIGVDKGGRYGCSCPAWIYDPKRQDCKHIRAFRANQ